MHKICTYINNYSTEAKFVHVKFLSWKWPAFEYAAKFFIFLLFLYVSLPSASLFFLDHLFPSVGGMPREVETTRGERKREKSSGLEDFPELDVAVLFEETERDPDEGPRN